MSDWTSNPIYENAKRLVDEHWSYVKKLIIKHDSLIPHDELERIEFHYKSSGIHFYGHGIEDALKEYEG